MPQKILDPLRNLPWHFQNLDIVKKLHDFKSGKHSEFNYCLSSTYGMLDKPTAMAFDAKLGLLAVGTEHGVIKIYGAPGVVFTVQRSGSSVKSMLFLPEEGRLISAATCGSVTMFELDATQGTWSSPCQVQVLQNGEEDCISCIGLGVGVLYVGSMNGTLRQVAIRNGHMTLGDDALTATTPAMVKESVPLNKRDEMGVDSPIVSLELQPGGNHLLIAYSGGCVAVAVPKPIPEEIPVELTNTVTSTEGTAPTAQGETVTPNVEDDQAPSPPAEQVNGNEEHKLSVDDDKSENVPKSMPCTPAKEPSEKRSATLKFKTLTRSLRANESAKIEKTTQLTLPVPPTPRISHLLMRDQPVEYATWRVIVTDSLSTEVSVAYGDGAFQVWPIVAAVDQENMEPIIVSMRDPPNMPYGPLPCGAIKKIIMNPGVNGLLTAFSGGLPRPQYENRHTVSLLQDHEHHVCFQFGSEVKDFILLPSESTDKPAEQPTDFIRPQTSPSHPTLASTLLVLTHRELVAIDLMHPGWSVYQCAPYLQCLNCTPVTVVSYVGEIPQNILQQLQTSTMVKSDENTDNEWPIWGGKSPTVGDDDSKHKRKATENNNLICFGHANGMVSFWTIGRGDTLYRFGTIETDVLFHSTDFQNNQRCSHSVMEDEAWPPFRRVGQCNTLQSDRCTGQFDPRMAITQLHMELCNKSTNDTEPIAINSLNLLVGQAGGQVSMWSCLLPGDQQHQHPFEPDVSRINANLIGEENSAKYVWDDLQPLRPNEGILSDTNANSGFYPHALIQLYPPSPIRVVMVEPSWNVMAIGSDHGFTVIDLIQRSVIHSELSLQKQASTTTQTSGKNVNHVAAVQQALISHGKRITANVRQSFRRLKSFRTSIDKSQAETATQECTADAQPDAVVNGTATAEEHAVDTSPVENATSSNVHESVKADNVAESETPVTTTASVEEKQPEATTEEVQPPVEPIHLSLNDSLSAPVKTVLFADTYIQSTNQVNGHSNVATRTPSLWVGTNIGKVFIYTLDWKATAGPINLKLCKDLQLHHHAPVLSLSVLDSRNCGPIAAGSRYRESHVEVPEPESPPTSEPTEQAQCETKVESAEAKCATDGNANAVSTATNTSTSTNDAQLTSDSHHYVLVCSEEQVKLFSLPSLRAVYKYKFVDRLRMPGLSSVIHEKDVPPTNTNSQVATETAPTDDKQQTTNEDETVENGVSPLPTTQSTPGPTTAQITSAAASTPCRKNITSIGLQEFISGTSDQEKSEWNVVVTLLDGQTAVLTLPTLRKVSKEPCYNGYLPTNNIPHVASQTRNNFVFWFNAPQLIVTELGQTPYLHSLATCLRADINKPFDFMQISLPTWVRPIVTNLLDGKPSDESEEQQTKATQQEVEGVEAAIGNTQVATSNEGAMVNGNKSDRMLSEEHTTTASSQQSKHTDTPLQNGLTNGDDVMPHLSNNIDNGLSVCDVTLDSVKEYINGDSDAAVTVRTTEISTEKRTLVEAGKITTTVHEVEKVDGKLVKNDIVKIVTDGEPDNSTIITSNA